MTFKRVSIYDSNGNKKEERVFRDGELRWIYYYTYEFDEFGNWIKQTKMEMAHRFPKLGRYLSAASYREITYYR